jgi:hypothetical protein
VRKFFKTLLFIVLIPIVLSVSGRKAFNTNAETVLNQLAKTETLANSWDENNTFSGNESFRENKPSNSIQSATLNVTMYGVVGDGRTDNTSALDKLILLARKKKTSLYFPDGTYLYNKENMNASKVRFIGQSKEGTIIKDSVLRNHSLDGADNITFQDFVISDNNTSLSRVFRNCKFGLSLPVQDSYVLFDSGKYTFKADVEIINCDFVFPRIWVGLYIRKYNSVLISNCTFNGDAWHNIRLDEPSNVDAKVNITGNTVTGGTTGIFIAPSQNIPMKGGLIEGNKLFSQKEESIAMDGFGNDPKMIPVLANGPIANATNDANGRVLISMDKMYYNKGVPAPVSLRKDWTNFYFSFGEGSGLEGMLVKIKDFNTGANTLTLDTIMPACKIILGGDAGVQSGFFNWTIRGNSVTGTWGANKTYGTAISVYLNVFGILVENNTVTNCAHGINLAGGLMLDHYRTLAYNNVIRNNSFIDCDKYAEGEPSEEVGVVRFVSYGGAAGPVQYNNKFENNAVKGGRIFVERQMNMVNHGNTLSDDVIVKVSDSK